MPPINALRTMALAFLGTPVLLAFVLWFVLGGDGLVAPQETWPLVALILLAVSCLTLILLVGYRAPAIPATTRPDEAARSALATFRTGLIVRFAIAETAMFGALALAFLVSEGGYLVFLVGASVTLALSVYHVVPSDKQIARTQAVLERAGARVPLREALHGDPVA